MMHTSRHRLKLLLLCTLLYISPTLAKTSSQERTRSYLEQLLQGRLQDGLIDEAALSIALEHIDALLLQPLNINQASAEDLADLYLLSPYQIYQLIRYRTDQGGQIASLYDLKTLDGWDEATLHLLAPLLRCDDVSSAHRAVQTREGHTTLALNTQHRLDAQIPKDYLGSGSAVALRWSYRQGQRFSAFAGAEQDTYEPWRYGQHQGFDSYAGHLYLGQWGLVRRAILGDYRVHWGEGLVIGQGFRLRAPYWQGNRRSAIRPISSLAESNKSRGLAVELGSERLQLSLIYSKRRLDGRIDDEGLIHGLSEQGLHRTQQEWERRRQISLFTWGARIGYVERRWHIALQTVATSFGGYRLARATGAAHMEALEGIGLHRTASLSYHWQTQSARLRLRGEVARADRRGWAWVQMLQYHSARWGEIQTGARYISPTYWAYQGQSHTHKLPPNGEAGLSLNYRTRELLPHAQLELAADWYRDLQTSRAREARYGRILSVAVEKQLGQLGLRLALAHKSEQNHKGRFRLALHTAYAYRNLQTQVGISLSRVGQSYGRMGYSRVRYSPQPQVSLWASLAFFDTDHWAARLYLAEPRLNYEYGLLMLSGRGARLSLGAQLKFSGRWAIGLRAVHQSGHNPLRLLSTHLSYRL